MYDTAKAEIPVVPQHVLNAALCIGNTLRGRDTVIHDRMGVSAASPTAIWSRLGHHDVRVLLGLDRRQLVPVPASASHPCASA